VKKEYLDFLYETRANIKRDLDEKNRAETFPDEAAIDMHKAWVEALEEMLQIQDKAIETYLRIHTY